MLFVTSSIALLVGVAHASALLAPIADGNRPARHRISRDKQVDTLSYWTQDRMLNAQPLREPHVELGRPKIPDEEDPEDETGAPWKGDGAVNHLVGKAYFHNETDGRDLVCTGTVVESDNKATVVTAGHCVYDNGNWFSRWMFVPGQFVDDSGTIVMPFGRWAATDILSTPEWRNYTDNPDGTIRRNAYDMGAAILEEKDERRVADIVGASRIDFETDTLPYTFAFGYPARFNNASNQRMIYSSGPTVDHFGDLLYVMGSIMTGGASGGPWFKDFDSNTGRGVLYSVTSGMLFEGILLGGRSGAYAFKDLWEVAQSIEPNDFSRPRPFNKDNL